MGKRRSDRCGSVRIYTVYNNAFCYFHILRYGRARQARHQPAKSKLSLLVLLNGFALLPPLLSPSPDLEGLASLSAVAAPRAPPLAESKTNGFGTVYAYDELCSD